MKKRVVVGSVLSLGMVLVACQEEAAQPKQENVEAPVEKEPLQEQISDYRQGYADILANYTSEYGLLGYQEVASYDEYRAGLLYAKLLDFNQDGFEELYIVYKDAPYKGGMNAYVQEIWSTTDAAQPAKQLHLSEVAFHEDYDVEIAPDGIGYVTLPDGQIAIRATVLDLVSQMPHEDHAVFTLQNSQFELAERYTLNAFKDWTYKKNGTVITEEDFTAQLEALDAKTTWIVKDAYNADVIEMIQLADEINNINNLQQQVTDTLGAQLMDSATVLDQTAESALHTLLEKYVYLRQLTESKETASALAVYYIFSNQVEYRQNEDYLLVYDVAPMIEKAKAEFNLELVAADFEAMNTPQNDSMSYENGTIISSIYDGFMMGEKNEIKRAKQLHDSVYYIEYENISVDAYGDFITEQDLQTPIAEWSSEKLQAVTNRGLQYIVVDLAGEGTLYYKSSQPLHVDELSKF
ncbi:MAG: hypothetical protein ABS949_09695 [Solibacillus sp.]